MKQTFDLNKMGLTKINEFEMQEINGGGGPTGIQVAGFVGVVVGAVGVAVGLATGNVPIAYAAAELVAGGAIALSTGGGASKPGTMSTAGVTKK